MLTNDKKVAVLLSTFNGAQFLPAQLDSLFSQTCANFHLYIRDDGSTDGTVDIVKSYAEKYCGQITFIEDGKAHRGAAGSFFYLLEEVDSEYYMFCDQDDVWFPNKIEVSLACVENVDQFFTQPIVAFSDLKVVDASLNVLNDSFNHLNHLDRYEQNNDFLFIHNMVTGCAMIFNKAAKEISFPVSPYAHMHDEWISLCTYTKGGYILPIKEALISYRQHGKNTIGARQCSSVEKIKSMVWKKQLVQKMRLVRSAFGVSCFKFIKLKIQFMRGCV